AGSARCGITPAASGPMTPATSCTACWPPGSSRRRRSSRGGCCARPTDSTSACRSSSAGRAPIPCHGPCRTRPRAGLRRGRPPARSRWLRRSAHSESGGPSGGPAASRSAYGGPTDTIASAVRIPRQEPEVPMLADRLTDSLCVHAEGPYWPDTWGGLRRVDMLAGDLMHLDPSGVVGPGTTAGSPLARIPTPSSVAACVRPAAGGGAVRALEKGFALEDADGSITPLPPLWEEDVRMNEGAVAPDGSFLCGTMAYDARPGGGAMWRLMPDGTTTRLFGDLTISNGLAFSADGARAFYVDTP